MTDSAVKSFHRKRKFINDQWSLWNIQDKPRKHTLLWSFPDAIFDKQNSFQPSRWRWRHEHSDTDSQTGNWFQSFEQCIRFLLLHSLVRLHVGMCPSWLSPVTSSPPLHVSLSMNFHLDSSLSGTTELHCADYIKRSAFCVPPVKM